MDAGTYQMSRITDPADSQYAPFTAENAVYYIPRQPAGVYPRWFAARVTYATLASPQHATGAGIRAVHPGRQGRRVEERARTVPAVPRRASAVHRDRRPGLRDPGSP